MEYIFVILVIALVAYIFIGGAIAEKRKKERLYARLKKEYGNIPDTPLHELKRYPDGYLRNYANDIGIDEITASDLDLDTLYERVNYCVSGVGAEYLYYMLRCPGALDAKKNRYLKQLDYLKEHEDYRMKMRMQFASLGLLDKYSLFDFLNFLCDVKPHGILRYIIKDVLLVAFLALCFVNEMFILPTVLIFLFSIGWYYKEKNTIQIYMTNMTLILRLMKLSKEIPYKDSEVFSEEFEEVREVLNNLRAFKRYAGIYSANTKNGSLLDVLIDYFRMTFHSDIILFYLMLTEIFKHKEDLRRLADVIGYGDAVISVAYYRASLDTFCVPEFTTEDRMETVKLYHPLLTNPVSNSFSESKNVLLTGSNASGKSTFLKTVAVNELLGQAIYTCCATRFVSPKYAIYSSMSLRDDIIGGESYYMVEIRSLKRILDAAQSGQKVICFIDEVLRGTNTVERIAASYEILKFLAKSNIRCFAATHDIELTRLLEEIYSNYHFEETVTEKDVCFDYHLHEGRASGRNAIALLRLFGYPEEITDSAYQRADRFLQEGIWE